MLDECRRRATRDVADHLSCWKRSRDTCVSIPFGTGLDVDQMDTSRGNARNFRNSLEVMLAGTLPATKSAALVNSYGYRYFAWL